MSRKAVLMNKLNPVNETWPVGIFVDNLPARVLDNSYLQQIATLTNALLLDIQQTAEYNLLKYDISANR